MIRRFARDESGAVAVLFAIVFLVLVGISALAVDVGYWYTCKRQLQTAADAGAMAGCQQLDPRGAQRCHRGHGRRLCGPQLHHASRPGCLRGARHRDRQQLREGHLLNRRARVPVALAAQQGHDRDPRAVRRQGGLPRWRAGAGAVGSEHPEHRRDSPPRSAARPSALAKSGGYWGNNFSAGGRARCHQRLPTGRATLRIPGLDQRAVDSFPPGGSVTALRSTSTRRTSPRASPASRCTSRDACGSALAAGEKVEAGVRRQEDHVSRATITDGLRGQRADDRGSPQTHSSRSRSPVSRR